MHRLTQINTDRYYLQNIRVSLWWNFYSSPNLPTKSFVISSIAFRSSEPSTVTETSIPKPAASCKTLSISFPSAQILVSSRVSVILLLKVFASRTSFAAARACRPSELSMLNLRSSILSHLLRLKERARLADRFLALSFDLFCQFVQQDVLFVELREFDYHGQVDAGNDLNLVFFEKHCRDICRCAAEHIGQN